METDHVIMYNDMMLLNHWVQPMVPTCPPLLDRLFLSPSLLLTTYGCTHLNLNLLASHASQSQFLFALHASQSQSAQCTHRNLNLLALHASQSQSAQCGHLNLALAHSLQVRQLMEVVKQRNESAAPKLSYQVAKVTHVTPVGTGRQAHSGNCKPSHPNQKLKNVSLFDFAASWPMQ